MRVGNKNIPDTLVGRGLIRRSEEAKTYLKRLYREGLPALCMACRPLEFKSPKLDLESQ
jgi:hypothetical protein